MEEILKAYSDFQYTESIDIPTSVQSSSYVETFVDSIIKRYQTIALGEVTASLENVRNYFVLAYAYSKRFHCLNNTILILTNYDILVKDISIGFSSFIDECLSAIRIHKSALSLAKNGNLSEAFSATNVCKKMAAEIDVLSSKLVSEVQYFSESTLKIAKADENVLLDEKKKIAKNVTELTSRKDLLEINKNALNKHINMLNHNIAELAKKIEEDVTNQLSLKDISTSNLNSTITLEWQLLELLNLKTELEERERVENSELSSVLEKLETLIALDNDISSSNLVKNFDLTIGTFGKMKNALLVYLYGIKTYSEKLKDLGLLSHYLEDGSEDKFIKHIQESGLNWLALGKIIYTASESMHKVDSAINELMNNLPTKTQADVIIQNETKRIKLSELKTEVSLSTNK